MTIMQRVFWVVSIGGGLLSWGLWSSWSLAPWLLLICTAYFATGIYDLYFSTHTLCRLYPVAAHLRFMLEFIRPEIRQYFIASNTEERPFNREERNLVYRRAKRARDTIAFGTERDLLETGFLSIQHSLNPTVVKPEHERVSIGGPDCTQPYGAARFNISAMSFGSLSGNAIRALNRGAKLGNFFQNTGEGGISSYHEMEGGDLVWQVGTGYFGCRTVEGNFDLEKFREKAQRPQVKMIEVKLSQGAKPAHGGMLPAAKVSEEIARIREVPVGKACLSPAKHSAFDGPKGLLEFIAQLREASGGKPVGFKLCIGVRSEFMSICKAMLKTGITPDFITVDGAEGGTGAAPVEFSNRLGKPCHEGLYFVHNCLIGCNLRDRIRLIGSAKTATGFHLLVKIALGADIVNAGRTMMMALGCIQSQSCNTNHCPTGIATQDPARGSALDVEQKSARVRNFQEATLESFFHLVGAMGLDDPGELTARHLQRRIDDETTKHYDEIYCPLQPGELLSDTIHPNYAEEWDRASAERF